MSNYYGWPPISQEAQDYANAWYGNGGDQPLDNGQWMVNNQRLTAAGEALKQANANRQRQYADLYQNDLRNQAMQRRNALMGTSHQNDFSGQYDASVLAGDNFQVQNGGQFGFAAGNQANNQLDEMEGRGTYVDDTLRQAATDQDFLWNLDGDTTGLKGVGSLKYNSMGVAGGTHTGNNSPFAYGANAFDDNGNWNQHSGANHFEFDNLGYNQQQLDNIKRGWRDDGRYSKNPMGTYGGPQGDGKNVHQFGDPRQNTGSNNNYQWLPPSLWPKGPVHDNNEINEGFASQDGNGNRTKAYVPTKQDTRDQYRQGVDDWRQFYDDKGYSYTPQNGNGAGWRAGANESRRNMGFTAGAMNPMASIADPPKLTAAPSPIKGSGFSEMNPNFDAFSQDLFIRRPQVTSPGTYGDSAFGHYRTDPFTAGRINARMSNYSLR